MKKTVLFVSAVAMIGLASCNGGKTAENKDAEAVHLLKQLFRSIN